MGFHDRPTNRKAHAHAFCLRRIERMKDLLAYLRGKARPIVPDGDFDLASFDCPGGDRQPLVTLVLHGLDGVADVLAAAEAREADGLALRARHRIAVARIRPRLLAADIELGGAVDGRGRDLYHDTRELSLQLAAQMIHLSGRTKTVHAAYDLAAEMITSGKALAVFERMCKAQNGDLAKLPMPKLNRQVRAAQSGFVSRFDVEKIGLAGILLRAGRMKNDDVIHPTAGIEFHSQLGDEVKEGDLLFTIHGDEPERFSDAEEALRAGHEISLQKPAPHALIKAVLT